MSVVAEALWSAVLVSKPLWSLLNLFHVQELGNAQRTSRLITAVAVCTSVTLCCISGEASMRPKAVLEPGRVLFCVWVRQHFTSFYYFRQDHPHVWFYHAREWRQWWWWLWLWWRWWWCIRPPRTGVRTQHPPFLSLLPLCLVSNCSPIVLPEQTVNENFLLCRRQGHVHLLSASAESVSNGCD